MGKAPAKIGPKYTSAAIPKPPQVKMFWVGRSCCAGYFKSSSQVKVWAPLL